MTVEGARSTRDQVSTTVSRVRRVGDGVVRGLIGHGQPDEARPVEVDPVGVDEIRVLAGDDTAGLEIDLALGFVHLVDGPDDPLPLRDLALDRAGHAVVEVEVVPAVALRHPDHFAAVGDVVAEFLAAVGEERLRLLVDDGPGRARRPVDLDDPVDLMAALVEFEGEGPAVLPPNEVRELVGIGEEGVVDLDPGFCVDREEDGPLDVEGVARLGVLHGMILGLELIGRRGLDILDDAVIAAAQAHHGELLRVRRPADGVERVVVPLRAVPAENGFLLLGLVPETDVVVPDEGLPLAVGRGLGFLGGGLGRRPPLPHGHAAAARAAGPGAFELLAGVRGEVARPAGAERGELDRSSVVAEGQVEERQIERLDLLPRSRGQARGELGVVEGLRFLALGRVGDPVLVAAGDGFPVPIARGLADPASPVDDVQCQGRILRPQPGRPLIIGLGDLGKRRTWDMREREPGRS